jgi:hypothetical protein
MQQDENEIGKTPPGKQLISFKTQKSVFCPRGAVIRCKPRAFAHPDHASFLTGSGTGNCGTMLCLFSWPYGLEEGGAASMKRFIIALTALAALTGTASAVEFGVGPGGVYVGPDRDRYNHRYYRDYGDDYGGGCRTVITHHTNRYGEDVTVRRRVCD